MIFTFRLTVDNTIVKPLESPQVNFNAMFNTIDFALSSSEIFTLSLMEKIKNLKYVSCVYSINGEDSNFIIDAYNFSESFGEKSVSFSGLSRTALIEERFSGLSGDMGTENVSQILSNINSVISSITVTNNISMIAPIETGDKSYSDIIRDIESASEYIAVTSFDGLTLKFIGGIYNVSDISGVNFEITKFSDLINLNNSFESDAKYNAIDIISGDDTDDIGELIIETKQINTTSYFLYVYTTPLLSYLGHLQLSSSDGIINEVSEKEVYSQDVLIDFNENKCSLAYPMHSVVKVEFFNKPNSLVTNVGEREISLANDDDLAVARLVYRTMRNVYIISELTEPIVKIKFEVI